MYSVFEQGQRYCVRYLHRYDFTRHNAYQRLRAKIFVKQSGWEIPVDERGRERDRYDGLDEERIQIACVYGKGNWRGAEYLLGGVRTHILRNWDDSMTINEFHRIGMIPFSIASSLKERYDPTDLLEITRLCLRRGHLYEPKWGVNRHTIAQFNMEVARDLVYTLPSTH